LSVLFTLHSLGSVLVRVDDHISFLKTDHIKNGKDIVKLSDQIKP